MTTAWLDFETYSEEDLPKAGAYRYAQHVSTDIICLYWCIDDGPILGWAPGLPFPDELRAAIEAGCTCEAHNAKFEKYIWRFVGERLYDFPEIDDLQWLDSQAVCAYRALPQKLEKAAAALRLKNQKDMDGHRKMLFLSRPDSKGRKRYAELPEPGDIDRLETTYEYCEQDVRTEKELSRVIRTDRFPAPEQALWRLDAKINERGVRIDIPAVEAALAVADQVKGRLEAELADVTGGEVTTVGQTARIVAFAEKDGIKLPNLQAQTVDDYLAEPDRVPERTRRVLEIRSSLAKASTNKYAAMMACVCDDGRARGLLQYHGAGPGRWAGRLIQPQNFPRPRLGADPDELVAAIMERDADYLEVLYGDPMLALADGTRSMIISDDDKVLASADFAAIEARVLMVLAGEGDAVSAFASGADLYCVLAEQIYGHPVNKRDNHEERQIGKVGILGCGYQMGAERFVSQVKEKTGLEIGLGLSVQVVDTYRKTYPGVPQMWRDLNDAATEAVRNPGAKVTTEQGISYQIFDRWLTCQLPSGRRLWYYGPQVERCIAPWSEPDDIQYVTQVTYWSYKFGQWRKVYAYGGLFTENVVQGTARDIMVSSMWRAEAVGYPIILTVHDDICAEPINCKAVTPQVLEGIMEEREPWFEHYPIAAEGWVANRMRK